MVAWRNDSEAGTNGAAVTVGNSGGGSDNAFNDVAPGTGGSIKYSNVTPSHGALCIAMQPASGQPCYVERTVPNASQVTARYGFKFSRLPPVAITIFEWRNGSGTPNALKVVISASGKLSIHDNADATLWTADSTIPVAKWFRIWPALLKGTTSSNGQMSLAYFLGNSLSDVDNGPAVTTGRNAGTSVITTMRVGKLEGSTFADLFWIDDGGADDGNMLDIPWVSVGKPSAPLEVTAAIGVPGQALVAWLPPTDHGGSAISGYTVVASTGETMTVSGTTTAVLFSGLAAVSTTFKVKATNDAGDSVLSAASNAVTPTTATPAEPSGGVFMLLGGEYVRATISQRFGPVPVDPAGGFGSGGGGF